MASPGAQMAASMQLYRGLLETGVAVMDPGWARQVREEIEEAQGLPAFWEIERQTVEAEAADYTGRTIAGYEGQDTSATP